MVNDDVYQSVPVAIVCSIIHALSCAINPSKVVMYYMDLTSGIANDSGELGVI